MTPDRSISLVIAASLPASRSDASRLQASCRRSRGHITESMPISDTPRRMNGATEAGKSIPPASPQAATAPPWRVIDSTLASVVEPTESMPPAHRSWPSGLAAPASSLRSMISPAPRPLR
jgi:hypothetical protein